MPPNDIWPTSTIQPWLPSFAPAGEVVRVAVKDAIDVAGVITTAGCRAVRDRAVAATSDAQCLTGSRAAGAHLVGKTTLTELCLSPAGDNTTFGTPVNPIAPDRIPGGSSSGSAVAVAGGEADLGLGTDTGGSIRIPAACCAIVGLKTTWGRVPTGGVWPLAPSLDVVGPLAHDVAGTTWAEHSQRHDNASQARRRSGIQGLSASAAEEFAFILCALVRSREKPSMNAITVGMSSTRLRRRDPARKKLAAKVPHAIVMANGEAIESRGWAIRAPRCTRIEPRTAAIACRRRARRCRSVPGRAQAR